MKQFFLKVGVTQIRYFRNEKGTGAKCVPLLFLGLLLGKPIKILANLFSLSLVTVPEV